MNWHQYRKLPQERRRQIVEELRLANTPDAIELLCEALGDIDVHELAEKALRDADARAVGPVARRLNQGLAHYAAERLLQILLPRHAPALEGSPALLAPALPVLASIATGFSQESRSAAATLLPLMPWKAVVACLNGADAKARAGAETLLRRPCTWRPASDGDRLFVADVLARRLERPAFESLEQALEAALGAGDAGVVELLLLFGASPAGPNVSALIFKLLARSASAELVAVLAASTTVRALRQDDRSSPLHVAVRRGDPALVRQLAGDSRLLRGVDTQGRSALALAKEIGASADLLHLLREANRQKPIAKPQLRELVGQQQRYVAEGSGACASLEDQRLEGNFLQGLVLERANLRGVFCRRQDLTGANLAGSNLAEADLEGTRLLRARLSGCVLTDAVLRGCDLRHADLAGADLRRADLTEARLFGAILDGARLDGATNKRAWGRYRLDQSEVTESECGPDYFTTRTFEIIDEATDTVLHTFTGSREDTYLVGGHDNGTISVELDGETAVVTESDGSVQRIPLGRA